jgi:hypothetical protein
MIIKRIEIQRILLLGVLLFHLNQRLSARLGCLGLITERKSRNQSRNLP